MLELLPSLLLAVLAVHGTGLVLGRMRGTEAMDPLMREGFHGLAALVVLATVAGALNLVLPLVAVAPWMMIPLAALGAWGLACRSSREFRLVFIGLLLVAGALAARSPLHGDTGLYHQQAVIWMSESALPYGLANLHGRFGFNSAWWSLAALLEFPWMPRGASMYLATPVLCVFFGLLFAGALRRAWHAGLSAPVVMILAGGYLWFRQMSGANNPSLSTDAPVNLFILASACALVMWRLERNPQALLVWAVLAAGAAAGKLTGWPWLVVSAAAVVWYAASPAREGETGPNLRQLLPAAAVAFVILAVNAIRGVVVSGYPFYPLKLAGFPALPWAARPETMGGDTAGIRNWPTRGEASGWGEFFVNWIENQYGLANVVIALLLALAASALLAFAWRRGLPGVRAALAGIVPLALAAALGLAVCFLYAPALRFVSGYFFVLVGLFFAAGLAALPSAGSVRRGRIVAILAFLFTVFSNAGGLTGRAVAWWQTPATPETRETLTVRTTRQGEPLKIGYAWDAQPPATPYFDPELVVVRDQAGCIREFRPGPDASR